MKLSNVRNFMLSVATASVLYTMPAQAADTVVDVAIGSTDHTTLVAAVQAAGLVETLQGEGKFTVFAPTNTAFGKLPDGTVDMLLKPESKDQLTKILTSHVVSGNITSTDLVAQIKANDGKFTFTTVSGDELSASVDGDKVLITDESGGVATVTAVDLESGNGVVHVIDGVLLPK